MNTNIKTNNTEYLTRALHGLYDVYDPEIGLNIVDLGLVYELNFEEDQRKLTCIMTLTTQFCPMGESITSETRTALTSSFLGWDVSVDLVFEPEWNFDFISATGQEFLRS